MNKGTAIVGFLLCFMAGMMLMWGIDRSGMTRTDISADAYAEGGEWNDNDAGVPVSSKDPMWGSRDAPVTLVLFSDYECPFCTRVEATIEQLKEKYGPDKLRVIWKHNPLPFHKNAMGAHIAAHMVFELGGNKAFWKFHELAFKNQKALTPANFEAWAGQAGVDVAKFKEKFAKQDRSKIDADMAIGRQVGVSGTPASFINGVFLSGAQPVNKFTAIIDEQLKAAEAEIAAGTPKDKVYAKLSTANKAKAPTPEAKQKPEEDSKTVWKVPAGDGPIKGNENALVTIVEFSDYQCPFCGKVNPTIKQIMDTYGDKVRIVWRDNPLPFHKEAVPAAVLAREARAQKGDEAFWKTHDYLFANQAKLKGATTDTFVEMADELGLDSAKVKQAIESEKYMSGIKSDQALAAEVQAGGTPHFFVNGRRLVGAQPFPKFKELIDEEIKKAQGLLDKGVKPADLYATLIKDGKEPPPPETKKVDPPQEGAAWKGNENAKVLIQEFSDLECPFCKRVEPTIDEVMANYGTQVKIVWRHKPLPMHPNAPLASEAAQEVLAQQGNDGFWKFQKVVFDNLGKEKPTRPNLDKWAEELGIDMTKFAKALDDNVHKGFVDADMKAADKAGISGTPAFSINEYFVSGAQPYSKFSKAIELALESTGGAGAKPAAAPGAAPGGAKPPAPGGGAKPPAPGGGAPKPPAPPAPAPYE